MTKLLISDLHLTDSPDDLYRWDIFGFLLNLIDEHKIDTVICLGDLTEKKDRHKDVLVNKIVEKLLKISEKCELICLKGNHDYYMDDNSPFFGFLDKYKNIKFITKPTTINGKLFLPHTRNPQGDWGEILNYKCNKLYIITTVYMHQIIPGLKYANDTVVKDTNKDILNEKILSEIINNQDIKIFSGDGHVPQTIKNITYVGTPYSIAYGDHYDGRLILIENGEQQNIYPDFLKKWSFNIREPKELVEFGKNHNWIEGDRVKVTLTIKQRDVPFHTEMKKEIKEICGKNGIELKGISTIIEKSQQKKIEDSIDIKKLSDKELVSRFVEKEKLGNEYLKIGLNLL